MAFALVAGSVAWAAPPTFASLIDGRGWELVTPVNKQGAALRSSERAEGGVLEASEAGNALTYLTTGAPVSEAEGNRPLEVVQNIATRTSTGWSSRDITTANSTLGSWQFGNNAEYKMFTSDLSSAVVEPPGNTPLSPSQTGHEQTLYLRDNLTNAFTPLVTDANVPASTNLELDTRDMKFLGASPDLRHVVVGSELPLTQAPAGDMYEWTEGQPADAELQPVSLLPNHEPTEGDLGNIPRSGGEQGSAGLAARNAVSTDGSLIIWEGVDRHLYLRDMATQETVQIDAPQPGASQEGVQKPEFQGASGAAFQEGGSGPTRIYFIDHERLTANSHAGEEDADLYVAELHGSPLEVTVTDLTPVGLGGEPADVLPAVLGFGEDAAEANIYYVAQGVLAPGAQPGNCEPEVREGTCSLYDERYDEGTKAWLAPRLVATLAGGDESDWGNGQGQRSLEQQSTRVSSNGQYLTFMSEASLTGYDNSDAVSGKPDSEVFLFDSQTNGVRCVSCNPTGALPFGALQPERAESLERPWTDPTEIYSGKQIAANLPGWETSKSEHVIYQPRYLSNTGRMYFDTSDALVPGDVNGAEDVYEYEPEGAPGGQCNASVQGPTEVYTHDTEYVGGVAGSATSGCLGLISSGTSSYESAFLDATESGEDVFFATRAQLVGQDLDNAYDIYDAHVCSQAAPCPTATVSAPPPCSSAEGCRGTSGSESLSEGAPASETLTGSGNVVVVPTPAPVVVKKTPTRAEKLAKALKTCKKLKAHKKRAKCESTARRKYGPVQHKVVKATRRSK